MGDDNDNIYVRCPSDVTQNDLVQDPSPAHFGFNFSHPLQFDNSDEWECGAHEIFLPKNYYNIYPPFNQNIMVFQRVDIPLRQRLVKNAEIMERSLEHIMPVGEHTSQAKKESEPLADGGEVRIHVTPGYYTCEQFVKSVNTQMKNKDVDKPEGRSFKYNHCTSRFKLTLAPGDIVTLGHSRMKDLLGYVGRYAKKVYNIKPHEKSVDLSRNMDAPVVIKHTHYDSIRNCVVTFPSTCDLDLENRHVFVYADCIKASRVGDYWANLMRIVNLSSSGEDSVAMGVMHREFIHRQYFPVRENSINSIEIKMTNSAGEAFPFKNGTTIVDLHFRRKKKKTTGKEISSY